MDIIDHAYWSPIFWQSWEEFNAMPANIPEWLWEQHTRHNAAIQCGALGVYRFYCADCKFTWKDTALITQSAREALS